MTGTQSEALTKEQVISHDYAETDNQARLTQRLAVFLSLDSSCPEKFCGYFNYTDYFFVSAP